MTDHAMPPGIAAAAAQFGPFDDRVWFNTGHQGPLPRVAVTAAHHAAELKAAPHRIRDDDFTRVPEHLRSLLAQLVGASPDHIALGNSTSHGLHLIANGIAWNDGDEVLIIAGDYPATVLPWRRLGTCGVRITEMRPVTGLLTADELTAAITPRTRLVAVTWVDSFTGRALDLDALGAVCRRAGVLLVVNASQALGARPIDVSRTPVDAVVSCGYKWLCGPYGTGFTWLHPYLLAQLEPQQAYWLAMRAGRGLDQMRDTFLRDDLGVRAFDVFCPANFLDVLPWTASLQLLLDTGIDAIARWDQHLIDHFTEALDQNRYRLVSPTHGTTRSTLVVLTDTTGNSQDRHRQLAEAGIDAAYREGNLRLSAHLFNTTDQVDRVLEALNAPEAN